MHIHTLLSVFDGHSMVHSQGSNFSAGRKQRIWSGCANAQIYLNFRCMHMLTNLHSQNWWSDHLSFATSCRERPCPPKHFQRKLTPLQQLPAWQDQWPVKFRSTCLKRPLSLLLYAGHRLKHGVNCEKTCLQGLRTTKAQISLRISDQPAHLINAIVIRVLESFISKLATSEISIF